MEAAEAVVEAAAEAAILAEMDRGIADAGADIGNQLPAVIARPRADRAQVEIGVGHVGEVMRVAVEAAAVRHAVIAELGLEAHIAEAARPDLAADGDIAA